MAVEKETTVKIPILRSRSDFRIWKDRLETHLRTKEIIYHIQYEVRKAILTLEMPPNQALEGLFIDVPPDIYQTLRRLPENIKQNLLENIEENLTICHEDHINIPDYLFSSSCECHFVIVKS